VPSRIFGPKRKLIRGGWKKLYKELHNLYSSPNIIAAIKLKRMRSVEQVAYITNENCIQNLSQET
jgi:hypothetical protein